MRVLIIEDSEPMADIMRRLLEPLATEVIVTADMQSALRVIQDAPQIEMITLDLGLPDSGVQDTLSRVGQIRALRPESLLIIITGQEAQEIERQAMEAGADAVLLKQNATFTPGGFLEMLRSIVTRCLKTPAKNFQRNVVALETVSQRLASMAMGLEPGVSTTKPTTS